MTSAHIIFIPTALALGGMLGFIFGARAARNAYDLERKRDEEREKVRAERAAKKAAKEAATAAAPAGGTKKSEGKVAKDA